MSRGKLNNKSINKILLRSSFILLAVMMFALGSVSYAKYVSTNDTDDSAGVAGMGVELFEMDKYGSYAANIDYTQVVPGADIPGPRISLKLNSEVSYTIYLRVTEASDSDAGFGTQDTEYQRGNTIKGKDGEGRTHDIVAYSLAPWWTYEGGMDPYTEGSITYKVKIYKYNLAADNTHPEHYVSPTAKNHVFKPATVYDYTADGAKTIQVLQYDSILISQYYGVQTKPKFYLSFEAFIRQSVDAQ